MSLHVSPSFLLLSCFLGSVACGAEGTDEVPGSGDDTGEAVASGGSVAPAVEQPSTEEPLTATGGMGGAESETEEEITHPLFGAGSYPSTAPTDPCVAAQRWEESTNLDLTTGALILHDHVVYEVTGIGKSESTWADEWTAPPCSREDAHCEDLAYRVVVTCN